MSIINRAQGKIEQVLKSMFCLRRLNRADSVFLTFDDGPEPGITEFVLEQLNRYNFKATFFCVGDTIENNKELYRRILEEGHAVASHTMHHSKGENTKLDDYCDEVAKFASIYNTKIFRPPYESLTPFQLFRIKLHGYKIILWSHDSTDWFHDIDAPYDVNIILKGFTYGSVILFHSCKKHEARTKLILPEILKEISRRGLKSEAIKQEML